MLLNNIKNQILSLKSIFNNINKENLKSSKSLKWQRSYQYLNKFIKVCDPLLTNIKNLNNTINLNYSHKKFETFEVQLKLIKNLINQLSHNHSHLRLLVRTDIKYDKEGYPISLYPRDVAIKITREYINTNSNALWGLLKQIIIQLKDIDLKLNNLKL